MSHLDRKLSADFLSREMDICFPEEDFKRLLLRFWMAFPPPPSPDVLLRNIKFSVM